MARRPIVPPYTLNCALESPEIALVPPLGLQTYDFHHEAKKYKVYWDVRKGLIPIVGGAREPGTSMLLEDVACPVDR